MGYKCLFQFDSTIILCKKQLTQKNLDKVNFLSFLSTSFSNVRKRRRSFISN